MAKCEVVKPEPVEDEYVLRLSRNEALLVLSLVGSVSASDDAHSIYASMRSLFSYGLVPDLIAEVDTAEGKTERGEVLFIQVVQK